MINNHCKFTTKQPTSQVAGLRPGDNNIEFIGISENKTALWLRNGNALPFQYLPIDIYKECEKLYLSDEIAVKQLTEEDSNIERQVELFIYYLYGGIDNTPDVINGQLQASENFRDSENCKSLAWKTKKIRIDGIELSNRDIKIIDSLKKDEIGKQIADKLFISESTYDSHKRNLLKKVGVTSKTALIIKALKQHV